MPFEKSTPDKFPSPTPRKLLHRKIAENYGEIGNFGKNKKQLTV